MFPPTRTSSGRFTRSFIYETVLEVGARPCANRGAGKNMYMEGVANHDVLFQSEGPLRTPVHWLLSQPWISAHYAWSPPSALVKPLISCDLMSCRLQESMLPCPKIPLAWLHWGNFCSCPDRALPLVASARHSFGQCVFYLCHLPSSAHFPFL